MNYYKILGPYGRPFHGGKGTWHLPKGRRPGRWMPQIKKLVPCHVGYHVLRRSQVIEWLGPEIWVCEIDGEHMSCRDKCVAERARLLYKAGGWDRESQKAIARDCIAHAVILGYCYHYAASVAFLAARSAAHAVANKKSASDPYGKAFAAERKWQTNRLFSKYLIITPP